MTQGILVKPKEVVVPGEILASGLDNLPGYGTYRNGENIHAGMLGLTSVEGRTIKLIPLAGKYIPKQGDVILAKVFDVTFSGWRAEINSAYSAMLSLKEGTTDFVERGADLTKYYTFEDYIVARITNVTSQNLVDLTMRGPGLRKLHEGRIISITSCKVPRVIGKKGSMVSMIKKATDCQITVGQNGWIWLAGKDASKEAIAEKTIKLIESKAHTSGLTEKVKNFLEKETGIKLEVEESE
ncbi:RNA-binding protein [Candidatus Woesearchaeota archaeon]|nr:RNA-binding protein [Candidatus Woesearchaeota archaeon]